MRRPAELSARLQKQLGSQLTKTESTRATFAFEIVATANSIVRRLVNRDVTLSVKGAYASVTRQREHLSEAFSHCLTRRLKVFGFLHHANHP